MWTMVRAGVVMLLLVTPGATPQESTVHLDVPMSPVMVTVDDVEHLIYELHVTNLRREPITMRRLRVVMDGQSNLVADLEGEALASLVSRVGLPRSSDVSLVIEPGRRSVVFLWTPIGRRTHATGSLRAAVRHQLDLQLADARLVAVHDAATPVSTAAVPVIDAPLAGGPWVAVYDPMLVGGHRTTLLALDGRARIPGRFAIDWIRAPASPGGVAPVDPARGFVADGFGADVLAVANGRVVDMRDGHPDLPPGVRAPSAMIPLADASGNHVVLDIGNGRYAVYEHLKRDSITVAPGDRVRRGQVIGQLGSSGSTSIGPHLHFHVADRSTPLAAEGMPFVFRQFDHVGQYESLSALVAGKGWLGVIGGPTTRERAHPFAMAVVHFRR